MKSFTLTALATLLAYLATPLSMTNAQVSFTSCSGSSPDMTVTAVSPSPYPPCKSQPFALVLAGTLNTPITSGARFEITGRYMGSEVYRDTGDLCVALASQGYACPVQSMSAFAVYRPWRTTVSTGVPIAFKFRYINGDFGDIACYQATMAIPSC